MSRLFTIGLEGTSAERFMSRLRAARIDAVVDVRLRPHAPCDAFARTSDLPYLLDALAGARYEHLPPLAPTAALVDGYLRDGTLSWEAYERAYAALLVERDVEATLAPFGVDERCALLCSEAAPTRCHRRLAAEHLASRWGFEGVDHI